MAQKNYILIVMFIAVFFFYFLLNDVVNFDHLVYDYNHYIELIDDDVVNGVDDNFDEHFLFVVHHDQFLLLGIAFSTTTCLP